VNDRREPRSLAEGRPAAFRIELEGMADGRSIRYYSWPDEPEPVVEDGIAPPPEAMQPDDGDHDAARPGSDV
jgi:hypothetical protein